MDGSAAAVWRCSDFDVDRYLSWIGHTGGREASVETLRAVCVADSTRIPWDNVDMFLGRPAVLDPPAILGKVVGGRGLTCEERTTQFAAALAALGFPAQCRSARVRMGARKAAALSHAVVVAQVDGREYCCDVGFGVGPLEPLLLEDGARSVFGAWEHAVRRERGEWVLSGKRPQGWTDLSGFADAPRYPVDNLVTNHYLATHPRSPFRSSLRACRMAADRAVMLEKGDLVVFTADEVLSRNAVPPQETPRVLAEEFGVTLVAQDQALVVAKAAQSSAG